MSILRSTAATFRFFSAVQWATSCDVASAAVSSFFSASPFSFWSSSDYRSIWHMANDILVACSRPLKDYPGLSRHSTRLKHRINYRPDKKWKETWHVGQVLDRFWWLEQKWDILVHSINFHFLYKDMENYSEEYKLGSDLYIFWCLSLLRLVTSRSNSRIKNCANLKESGNS